MKEYQSNKINHKRGNKKTGLPEFRSVVVAALYRYRSFCYFSNLYVPINKNNIVDSFSQTFFIIIISNLK